MSNIAVHVDEFFKKHMLTLLNGKIEQYNLNDLTIWNLNWDKNKKEVQYLFCLHPDSITASDKLEAGRISEKSRPNKKEKEWMYHHNAKGNFIIISTWSKKEKEALKQFCKENKIPLTRYNRPKSYNIKWWGFRW